MSISPPYPDLEEYLTAIGEAGQRLSDIEASEGAAGNISIFLAWPVEPRRKFPLVEEIALPEPAPALAGGTILTTGSGRRLREIITDPVANLGCVVVNEGGRTAQLYTSPRRLFTRLTSEFNSHLAVHADQVTTTGTNFHAVIHAQPLHLTYLSHIARYRDEAYMNGHLLRWQPETIVNLPEGVGVVPFLIPGSPELQAATVISLRNHRVIVWSKHGGMARSDTSVKRAADRIEYAETSARYEYMNLVNGEIGEGLTPEEIRTFAARFGIEQKVF
jgi:rhamnulose-1-phosphate aldolase